MREAVGAEGNSVFAPCGLVQAPGALPRVSGIMIMSDKSLDNYRRRRESIMIMRLSECFAILYYCSGIPL